LNIPLNHFNIIVSPLLKY